MDTNIEENFIELIRNNGFRCSLNNGAIKLFGSQYATIMIENSDYSNTPVKFSGLQNFMTFKDAKEYFIEHYVGIRKVANNHE